MKEIIANLLTWSVFIAMISGTCIGMVIGAMPGLSASMCVALLIPVTFSMESVPAIVMLVSGYCAAVYGGSFTAILLHTPGTPSNAATAMDGYAMTLKGEGYKAVGIASLSSCIGGIIGGIFLLLIAPPLANIALKFGAAEYFLIAVFGLTIIASLASESLLKGLLSGIFGLLIACIGVDAIAGYPRYTFGVYQLESGIQIVPAIVGMFSVSQVLVIVENLFKGKKSIVNAAEVKQGKVIPPWKEFRKLLPTIGISSLIGTAIGILPGVGGDIGGWVAYNTAKQSSKTPEAFGKGSAVGIAAAEASNNAVVGGSLIPLLTLGIPGSGTAAILLGGLMIHNLVPGYNLFTEYGHLTYPIIIAYILVNILMTVIGLSVTPVMSKIATVPMVILCPIIVGASFIGAYSLRNSMFDVYVVALCGIAGYVMRKTGFPTAPCVLGIVLGPMTEKNLRRSMQLARKTPLLRYYLNRPICVILIIIILASLVGPSLFRVIRKHLRAKAGTETAAT